MTSVRCRRWSGPGRRRDVPGKSLSGAEPPLLRPVARHEVGQHEGAHPGGAGDGSHPLHRGVGAEEMAEEPLLRRASVVAAGADPPSRCRSLRGPGRPRRGRARRGSRSDRCRRRTRSIRCRCRTGTPAPGTSALLDERGRDADAVVLVTAPVSSGCGSRVGVCHVPGGMGTSNPRNKLGRGGRTAVERPVVAVRGEGCDHQVDHLRRAGVGFTAWSPAGQGGRRTARHGPTVAGPEYRHWPVRPRQPVVSPALCTSSRSTTWSERTWVRSTARSASSGPPCPICGLPRPAALSCRMISRPASTR